MGPNDDAFTHAHGLAFNFDAADSLDAYALRSGQSEAKRSSVEFANDAGPLGISCYGFSNDPTVVPAADLLADHAIGRTK